MLISRACGGTTLYYLYNGHGDVVNITDSTGAVVMTYNYDAFGNVTVATGSIQNSILYAGYQFDGESGMYYLNARYYDPVVGRFISSDTYLGQLNDPLSLNLYTYCKNEPVMNYDPSGHIPVGLLDQTQGSDVNTNLLYILNPEYYENTNTSGASSTPTMSSTDSNTNKQTNDISNSNDNDKGRGAPKDKGRGASEYYSEDTQKILDDIDRCIELTNDPLEYERLGQLKIDVIAKDKAHTPYVYANDKIDNILKKNAAIASEYAENHSFIENLLYFANNVRGGGDMDIKEKTEWQIPYDEFDGKTIDESKNEDKTTAFMYYKGYIVSAADETTIGFRFFAFF